MKYNRKLLAMACLFLLPAAESVNAQQITGTPGSPSATTTIDGNYIPNPPPAFGGEINLNAQTPSRGGRQTSSRPRVRPTSC